MTSTNNGVRKEITKSLISLDELKISDNQKAGTITAQIRQTITTKSSYPSKKVDSNLQDSLVGAEAFGFESKDYTSTEQRVAWVPVPVDYTVSQTNALLATANNNGACIYKVLSAAPILDDNQKYSVAIGQRSLDQYADAQAVRYPVNSDTQADGTANKLVLDVNGNVQYRRTFFSGTPKEDVDIRETETAFQSAAIKAELSGASVLAGQTI